MDHRRRAKGRSDGFISFWVLLSAFAAAATAQTTLYGSDFSDLECSGDVTRSFHVEDYPASAATAAASGCIGPLESAWHEGEWSIMGEYCDFSSEPPMLRGTWYGSRDCSSEAHRYDLVADGSCVTHDSHSSKYNCVQSTATFVAGAQAGDYASAESYCAGIGA